MDRGAWWAAVFGVAQSLTQLKWLSSSSSSNIHIPLLELPTYSVLTNGDDEVIWWWLWASLVAQVVKNPSAMQETQVWSLGLGDRLEKGMATHSSILAWRIPRTEEPGGPQSTGLQRAGHGWVSNTFSLWRLYESKYPISNLLNFYTLDWHWILVQVIWIL